MGRYCAGRLFYLIILLEVVLGLDVGSPGLKWSAR